MKISRTLTAVVSVATAIGFVTPLATPTIAATASANLGLTATVSNNCTIGTVSLGFGTYDPVAANASTDLDGSGTVVVACTKGATATIGLGLGSSATGSTRRVTDGSSFLTYELYSDASHSTVWGNSGSALVTAAAATSRTPRNFTVYGRIPSNQDVSAGTYSDTVVATVNF
jgi:spore coat protein U-like protein